MDDSMKETSPSDGDVLDEISIDDRFRATVPNSELPSEITGGSGSSVGETVSTPRNLSPDSFLIAPESTEDDVLIGQIIGNYEVVSQLGRGGFGSVYKARDTKLQRFAALKFLRFPLDKSFRKSFEREAQVIANLGKHPSIVQIYSWGEHQGSQYFALEFLDKSAESHIKRQGEPFSVRQALEIIVDCAGALHYAHEQGVLHCDIKPGNILIDSKTGRAKLCDFGLAKFNALATGTDTRTIAGSPPYMAPEQIVGKGMDARTDVYSLGVTLYEMLSRELPYTGSSQIEILDKIRNRKSTPLREYRPDLSDSILEIVKRATAFRPEDRFQSAEEMQIAVRSVLQSLDKTGSADNVVVPSSVLERARSSRFRPRVLVAAAAVAAALIVGVFLASRSFEPSGGSGGLWPTAVAAAKDQIDAGRYDEAIEWLETYVNDNGPEDFAQYALGYAHLLSNQVTEAEAAFVGVSDPGLRQEGMAAVSHAKLGEEARSSLQAAATEVPTDYPAVLIASLDILNNEYGQAIKRLEAVNDEAFNFEWQRRRYGELMARAYYNSEQYDKAEAMLASRSGASDTMAASVNEIYATMAKRQLDEERRGAARQQIEQIKQLADSIEARESADTGDDEWTSRPFRVRISQASTYNCRLAEENGLVGVFPDLLADSLVESDGVPIELVDREYIGDVLYEQQLAELSKDVDSVQLGKLLGARLMIESEFKGLMNENFVWVKIIDTETTKFTKVESKNFDRRTDAREWARDLGIATRTAIEKAYPVQGIVTAGQNGPVLNVGENVGVRPGMKFAVYSAPGLEHRLENVTAVASNSVGHASATITLEPAGVTVPEGGWYLRQIQE